jgi:hypothetical protein
MDRPSRTAVSQPSVWTAATNPWMEELTGERDRFGERPKPPRGFWRHVLSWLTEYNRY